jgi:DNA primase
MDEQQLRAVLKRTNIVKVIGSFIEGKIDARGYYGSCPFCAEAGFMRVSARSQLFYCFCCYESGTALRFVMLKEHLSAEDALEWLEKRGK